jgi:hypothetical protein
VHGEVLPPRYARNYVKYLLKNTRPMMHVNQVMVRVEMDYLCDHMVIGSFVGVKPSSLAFEAWLTNLNNLVGEGKMLFHDMLKRGFSRLRLMG